MKFFLTFLMVSFTVFAQQGDRKGHVMTDPIPADKIPKAPVLNEDDSLNSFKVAKGFILETVAFDDLLADPVAISFDAKGRIWACEMIGYMPDADGDNEERPVGRVVILEDTDKDGRMDKKTVFLDKLSLPRAIACTHGGILLGDHEHLYFIDNNNDKAGKMLVVDKDYAKGGHVEAKSNGLLYGLDNWFYNAQCDRKYRFYPAEESVPLGKEIFRHKNFKIVLAKTEKRGQWGIATDDYGRLYTNTNSTLIYGEALRPNMLTVNPGYKKNSSRQKIAGNRVYPTRMNPGINRGYMKGMLNKEGRLVNATGACGLTIYRGDNFPKSYYGVSIIPEPCANMVKAISIKDSEGRYSGTYTFRETEILASTDERFRPVNAYTAPDGTLYIVDLYRGILQHKKFLTTYLRKQILSRGLDKPIGLGRIYRLRWKEKEAAAVEDLSNITAEGLIKYLGHANGYYRDTARRLIIEKGKTSISGDLNKVIASSRNHVEVINVLWTLEGLNCVSMESVHKALGNSHSRVKAHAIAVSTRLKSPAEFAKKLPEITTSADYNSALEIVHAAPGFKGKDALQAVNSILKKFGSKPYIKEAAIHGLYKREIEYLAYFSTTTDPSIVKELIKANKPPVKIPDNRKSLAASDQKIFDEGKKLFYGGAACFSCHGNEGQGMPDLGPPLVKSEWVSGSDKVLSSILLAGMAGKITVNKKEYNPPMVMPGLAQAFKDRQLAAIATFIRNSWGNKSDAVKEKTVEEVRKSLKNRVLPFSAQELLKK